MTRSTLAFLVPLILLAAPALASGSSALLDAVGDETVQQITITGPGLALPDCDAPSADIRSLTVTTTDELLVVTLALGDLSEFEADCGPVDIEAERARYEVSINEEYPEDPTVYVHDLGFGAFHDARGWTACGRIGLPDGAYTVECAGTFAVDGDGLVWTLPIAGELLMYVYEDPLGLTGAEEMHAYDLRGLVVERSAGSRIEFSQLPFTSSFARMRDSVWAYNEFIEL